MLAKRDGEKLRGRLQFASAQVFSRGCRRLLKVLSNHVPAGRQTLSARTRECLIAIKGLLTLNTPRKIEASQAEVAHVYVDASLRPSEVQWSRGHGSRHVGKDAVFLQ